MKKIDPFEQARISLQNQLHTQQIQGLWIAVSGGTDSMALLHWWVDAQKNLLGLPKNMTIQVVYVDHGLCAESKEWGRFVEKMAKCYGCNFLHFCIGCQDYKALGLEGEAREKRYQCLRDKLPKDYLLCTAHHCDDQTETILLNLKRGTALEGLRGIAAWKSFGKGYLARPFLQISKKAILDYSIRHHIASICDPSNTQTVFDRNFLRLQILPRIRERWPSFDHQVSQCAKHCSQQSLALQTLSWHVLSSGLLSPIGGLQIQLLKRFPTTLQAILIREWIKGYCQKPGSAAQLQNLLAQIKGVSLEHLAVKFGHLVIRFYKDTLLAVKPLSHSQKFLPLTLSSTPNDPILLPAPFGRLWWMQDPPSTVLPWFTYSLPRSALKQSFAMRNYSEMQSIVALPPQFLTSQGPKRFYQKYHLPLWVRPSLPLPCMNPVKEKEKSLIWVVWQWWEPFVLQDPLPLFS